MFPGHSEIILLGLSPKDLTSSDGSLPLTLFGLFISPTTIASSSFYEIMRLLIKINWLFIFPVSFISGHLFPLENLNSIVREKSGRISSHIMIASSSFYEACDY